MRNLIKLKSLFILCLVICFSSCGERTKATKLNTEYSSYDLIELDGCEYYRAKHGKQLAHKGNCNNPIHNCR